MGDRALDNLDAFFCRPGTARQTCITVCEFWSDQLIYWSDHFGITGEQKMNGYLSTPRVTRAADAHHGSNRTFDSRRQSATWAKVYLLKRSLAEEF